MHAVCVHGNVCARTHVFSEVEKTWKDILTGCPLWIDEWLGHVVQRCFLASESLAAVEAQRRPDQPLTCATLLTQSTRVG